MSRATEYERYMLELVNAERAKVGAPPLQLERNLNRAADNHSAWMLAVDIFSHTGVDGSSPTDRIRDAQFDLSGAWRTAENIAVQSERGAAGIMDDVANLHTSLMNSPGHRANILNPALDYIGIGIALGDFDFDSGTYRSVIVTQKFASTAGNVDLDEDIAVAPVQAAVVVAAPEPEPEATEPVADDDEPAADKPDAAQRAEQEPVAVAIPAPTAAQDTPSVQNVVTEDTFVTLFGESGADLFAVIMQDLSDSAGDNTPAAANPGPAQSNYEGGIASLAKDLFEEAAEEFALAVQAANDGVAL